MQFDVTYNGTGQYRIHRAGCSSAAADVRFGWGMFGHYDNVVDVAEEIYDRSIMEETMEDFDYSYEQACESEIDPFFCPCAYVRK